MKITVDRTKVIEIVKAAKEDDLDIIQDEISRVINKIDQYTESAFHLLVITRNYLKQGYILPECLNKYLIDCIWSLIDQKNELSDKNGDVNFRKLNTNRAFNLLDTKKDKGGSPDNKTKRINTFMLIYQYLKKYNDTISSTISKVSEQEGLNDETVRNWWYDTSIREERDLAERMVDMYEQPGEFEDPSTRDWLQIKYRPCRQGEGTET